MTPSHGTSCEIETGPYQKVDPISEVLVSLLAPHFPKLWLNFLITILIFVHVEALFVAKVLLACHAKKILVAFASLVGAIYISLHVLKYFMCEETFENIAGGHPIVKVMVAILYALKILFVALFIYSGLRRLVLMADNPQWAFISFAVSYFISFVFLLWLDDLLEYWSILASLFRNY